MEDNNAHHVEGPDVCIKCNQISTGNYYEVAYARIIDATTEHYQSGYHHLKGKTTYYEMLGAFREFLCRNCQKDYFDKHMLIYGVLPLFLILPLTTIWIWIHFSVPEFLIDLSAHKVWIMGGLFLSIHGLLIGSYTKIDGDDLENDEKLTTLGLIFMAVWTASAISILAGHTNHMKSLIYLSLIILIILDIFYMYILYKFYKKPYAFLTLYEKKILSYNKEKLSDLQEANPPFGIETFNSSEKLSLKRS